MDITATIVANLDILDHLSAETTPILFRLKETTSIIKHLRGFMLHMLSYSYPVWPEHQPRFYLFSKQHLKTWCNGQGITGSINSWQSHLIFLADCKLITFFRPTSPSADPVINKIWQRSASRGELYCRAETLWSVPDYTPDLLSYAERVAAEYTESRINLSHLTKEEVIRVRGQAIANSLYLDARTQKNETIRAYALAKQSLLRQIRTRNYGLVDDIWQDVWRAFLLDRVSPFTQENDVTNSKYNALQKIMNSKQSLASDCGCIYRQSTRNERTALGLPTSFSKWLFLPREGVFILLPFLICNVLREARLPRKAGALLFYPKEVTHHEHRTNNMFAYVSCI